MRPLDLTVTSAAARIIPMDRFAGDIRIVADYTAGTNYTVEYTVAPIKEIASAIWVAVTGMSSATQDASALLETPATALRLTHTGTNGTRFQILHAAI